MKLITLILAISILHLPGLAYAEDCVSLSNGSHAKNGVKIKTLHFPSGEIEVIFNLPLPKIDKTKNLVSLNITQEGKTALDIGVNYFGSNE